MIHTQAETEKPSKNWTPQETDEHPVHSTRTQWPAANELTTTTVQVLEQREGKTRLAPVALKQNWRPVSSLYVRENWPENGRRQETEGSEGSRVPDNLCGRKSRARLKKTMTEESKLAAKMENPNQHH
jgi:hypothetical protein